MLDSNRIMSLLNNVPKAPESVLPKGVTDIDCIDFEKRNGLILPHCIREWLKISNGAPVGPGGLYGIGRVIPCDGIDFILELIPAWKQLKWIPIAGDGCGNQYVVPTQQEFGIGCPVLFVETTNSIESPLFIVASGIMQFLIFILEKELGEKRWPFNKQYVLHIDPEITRFKGVDFPWSSNHCDNT